MTTPNDPMESIIRILNESADYEEADTDNIGRANFTPEDYALAKKLVEQVGGAAEARDLIDNLDQALEVLDMADYDDGANIQDIASYTPDSVEYPVMKQ
tara:strand:+ start:332 stop:628 length:297 start_codon:yes stop_codon:yes gene_type:complete